MISSDWNHDTVVSRFVTARLSSLAKTDNTIPGFSLPFDREFVSEHKLFEPIPHHRVSQILFLFDRHNEMWVRVRAQGTREHAGRNLGEPGKRKPTGLGCQPCAGESFSSLRIRLLDGKGIPGHPVRTLC